MREKERKKEICKGILYLKNCMIRQKQWESFKRHFTSELIAFIFFFGMHFNHR